LSFASNLHWEPNKATTPSSSSLTDGCTNGLTTARIEDRGLAQRQLIVHTRFRYGKRSFIHPGDKFRSSGGPVYIGSDDAGRKVEHSMGETGVFVFQRYCELGASKWIEATSETRRVIIYVGRQRRSPRVDGIRLRPHKIRPVYNRRKKREDKPLLVQRELF
jgi:hypothetical protein